MGESFLFSRTDAAWKAKRQACSHAFYKGKLEMMLEVMKDLLEARFEKWLASARSSPDKTTVIDISEEHLDLMSRNIIKISFGEDINDELFEISVRKTKTGSEFVKKEVTMAFALQEIIEQHLATYGPKLMNPLRQLNLMDFSSKWTAYQREVQKNCFTVRQKIRTYIRDRQSGKRQSKVNNKSDILSMFFENPDVFTEDFMVDELVDFFIAGSQTI